MKSSVIGTSFGSSLVSPAILSSRSLMVLSLKRLELPGAGCPLGTTYLPFQAVSILKYTSGATPQPGQYEPVLKLPFASAVQNGPDSSCCTLTVTPNLRHESATANANRPDSTSKLDGALIVISSGLPSGFCHLPLASCL